VRVITRPRRRLPGRLTGAPRGATRTSRSASLAGWVAEFANSVLSNNIYLMSGMPGTFAGRAPPAVPLVWYNIKCIDVIRSQKARHGPAGRTGLGRRPIDPGKGRPGRLCVGEELG
jgi:hypothetical protein